jgi:hypothetical protein
LGRKGDFDIRCRTGILDVVFKEIRKVRQEPIAGHRRWFDDDVLPLELIVWYDAGGTVDGFQLCYNLGRGEHALTWRPKVGFAHSAVDSGTTGPFANRTPILIPDGAVPWEELAHRVADNSGTLEPELRALIDARLKARK